MSSQSLVENKNNNPLYLVITVGLMLVTVVLAIVDIEACLNIFYTIMALTSATKADASLWGSTAVFFLGILALAYVVISFEYHMKHVWQPQSRKLFAISIGIQLLLALIGFVLL